MERKRVPLGNYITEYSVRNRSGEDIPVYSVTNSQGFCTEYFDKEVASKDKTTYKIVPRGYFAYNPSRINVGSVDWQRCEGRVIVSPLYNVFSVSEKMEQQYLFYFLKSNVGRQMIKAKASGSVRDNLKMDMLKEMTIPVCSFSNRYGGYIIMGVEDGGKPIGINKKLIKDMKKNFVNQLNNPDKMSHTLYLSIEEIEYEGMTLLWVFVPPTSTVEKCANRIYDRNEDGDMDITDSPIQLQNLYNRKSNTYAERKIFPYVTTADLRLDLLEKVRNLAKSKKPGIEGKYR